MSTVTYRYLAPSAAGDNGIRLNTSGQAGVQPLLFMGLVTEPRLACRGILALADVAISNFAVRGYPPGIDPVVTAGDGRLRLESVSRCGGVYARFDLLPASLDGELLRHGTASAEAGAQFRLALPEVRRRDPLRLIVGADATLTGAVTERTAPLPSRRLHAFTAPQVFTAGFLQRAELAVAEAMAFLHGLPGGARDVVWAVPDRRTRSTFRLASQPVRGAVCLPGVNRLRALLQAMEAFQLPGAVLQAYGPTVSRASLPTASTWVLAAPAARLSLTLSPGPMRGLSDTGTASAVLADPTAMDDADLIAAVLAWDPVADVTILSRASGLAQTRVRAGLAVLAVSGQIGYDVAEAAYFCRALPFDATRVERTNPRLAAARALVEQGSVRLLGDGAAVTTASRVYRLRPRGTRLRCVCRSSADDGGEPGPCQHELAAWIRQHSSAIPAGAPGAPSRVP